MHSVTGFQQEAAPHIKQSELCATCHTLITQAFGPDGAVIGELPEQMNYQEWQHSDYARRSSAAASRATCRRSAGPIRISSVLGDAARQPGAPHLRRRQRAHAAAAQSLSHRARRDGAAGGARSDGAGDRSANCSRTRRRSRVSAPQRRQRARSPSTSTSRNLTGHKFPTGYPSRRTWLHVTVRDARGAIVFESGAIDRCRRRFAATTTTRDAATYEPHYEEITAADQVQIYESILGDRAGAPTTGLLTATQYLKDNRLLPRGFDKATAAAGDRRVRRGARAMLTSPAAAIACATGCRCPARVRIASTSSCGINRSATAGRRTSSRSRRDEPARFVSYYKGHVGGFSVVVASATVHRRNRGRHDPELSLAPCIRRSFTSRSCSPSSARPSAWCRCWAGRHSPVPRRRRCCLLAALAAVRVRTQSGTAAHGPVERIPGVRPAVQEHEEWGERTQNGAADSRRHRARGPGDAEIAKVKLVHRSSRGRRADLRGHGVRDRRTRRRAGLLLRRRPRLEDRRREGHRAAAAGRLLQPGDGGSQGGAIRFSRAVDCAGRRAATTPIRKCSCSRRNRCCSIRRTRRARSTR